MIKIFYNNHKILLNNYVSIKNVLEKHHQDDSPFAIALNGIFIRREDYDKTILKENDNLQVIIPMQGG